MWLISWLTGKASKVLEWFGGSYQIWKNRIINLFKYLRQYRDQAYKWAVDYLFPLIISYWKRSLNSITAYYNKAINWTNKKVFDLGVWLSKEVRKVETVAREAYKSASQIWIDVKGRVQAQIDSSRAIIKAWVLTYIPGVIKPFTWILAFKDLLQDLKELFTEENKGKLITLFGSLFSFILDFATHPVRVLIAIIQPVLLELLNFSVAYALGTVDAELPAWPDWSTSGRGGGGAILPPGVKRDLVSPLASLRISGYTFNNPSGHMGLDLGLRRGEPVYTMHAGRVEFVNRAFTGYGYQVTVRGGDWWSRYAHLETIIVKPGQTVSKGEMLGRGDSTGNSTGDHLHLEIKYKGSFTDPKKILF